MLKYIFNIFQVSPLKAAAGIHNHGVNTLFLVLECGTFTVLIVLFPIRKYN